MAAARRFGLEGHRIALIARSRSRVDALASQLRGEGLTVCGYSYDVRNPASVSAAVERTADALGPIEVLLHNPAPHAGLLRPVLNTHPADFATAVAASLHTVAAAVQHVLPGMRARGKGSLLFVNRSRAVRPSFGRGGTSVAFAGEDAYAELLHRTLAPENIHVGQLVLLKTVRPGHATHHPDAVAERLWNAHSERIGFRVFADALNA
ncbi:hypothetical protein BIV57_04305 [Mangrovactinospora gilvigrisea]|uniref:Short-chain dehydrogenase n=2 Tax=Mangrovactinospora gilvigrisea TaxID=1428644 RepID=A0A1J7CGD8_9ACTN|nr:hypothetical protein BIV57_04305 [Mangrovactinospora gilvigrisea]